jgi:hypothetical protein
LAARLEPETRTEERTATAPTRTNQGDTSNRDTK